MGQSPDTLLGQTIPAWRARESRPEEAARPTICQHKWGEGVTVPLRHAGTDSLRYPPQSSSGDKTDRRQHDGRLLSQSSRRARADRADRNVTHKQLRVVS